MDKTIAGLLGAVGALVAGTSAQAAPAVSVLHATSYSDLLRPVPNAVEALKALDAAEQAQVETVQYGPTIVIGRDHHHHHHHHRVYRRPRHHHHHHHNNYGR